MHGLFYRIESAVVKRMAFGQTQDKQAAAFNDPVFGERLFSVLGTAGRKTAVRAQKRREAALVGNNKRNNYFSGDDVHVELACPLPLSFPLGGRTEQMGAIGIILRSVSFCLFFCDGLKLCGRLGWPFFSGNHGYFFFSVCWAGRSFSSHGPCYKLFLNHRFIIQSS
jgi:hypothetical protein